VPVDPGDVTLRRMAHAENYNRWLLERGARFIGRRVLDLGAGIGTNTAWLADCADLVVAVEPHEGYVRLLERRFQDVPSVRVVHAAAETLELSESFDTAVCFNVLEHIVADEEALRRAHEHLDHGGRLLLLVPAHPALYGTTDRTVLHQRRYAKAELRSKLAGAGFDTETLRYVNPMGALGWFVSSRLLSIEHVPFGPLRAYDRFVPLLRVLDRLPSPFGLSLWAVAQRP
jgi:SAM-dependent methyltransferase